MVRGWKGRTSPSVTLVPRPHKTTKQTGSARTRLGSLTGHAFTTSKYSTLPDSERNLMTHHCQCPYKGPIQVIVPSPAVRWRLDDCSSALTSNSVFSHFGAKEGGLRLPGSFYGPSDRSSPSREDHELLCRPLMILPRIMTAHTTTRPSRSVLYCHLARIFALAHSICYTACVTVKHEAP